MGFWSRLLGRRTIGVIEGSGRFACPIVGESHYQDALEATCGGRTGDGVRDFRTSADLILEDSNPYDALAVRVDIGGRTVGYLDRATARSFREAWARVTKPEGTVPRVDAQIRGGWDRGEDDRGNFGVWLDLSVEHQSRGSTRP